MNSNILRFRPRPVTPPVARGVRAADVIRISRFVSFRITARCVLVARWERNPDSGRLECRWVSERCGPAEDDPAYRLQHATGITTGWASCC